MRYDRWLLLGMVGSVLAGCGTTSVTASKSVASHSPPSAVKWTPPSRQFFDPPSVRL